MSELPAGWAWAELHELLSEGPTNGYSPKSDESAGGTLTLRLGATTNGYLKLDSSTTKRIHEQITSGSSLWLKPDDILVQRSNTLEYVGAAALVEGPVQDYIYPDLMMRIRVNQAIAPEFLWRFLNSTQARSYLRSKATGTAGNMPKITGAVLRSLSVPLPPLPEQSRIAISLRELYLSSGTIRKVLESVAPQIHHLRQSVLSSALRGDLTADWRDKNPNAEPASKLLSRIRAERRRIWEEAELEKMRARGKAPLDDRWKAKYEEPEPVDESELPKLPEGWAWTSLEAITDPVRVIRYGILMPGPDQQEEGVPYVKVMHMRQDGIDTRSLPRTTWEIHRKFAGATLRQGDVLLAIRGTYGRVAEVPQELDGSNITQDSARIAPIPGVSSRFLALTLRAPFSQKYFKKSAKGVAVQGLNIADVRLTPIALPPEAEQEEIVLRSQRCQSSMRFIETKIEEVESDLQSLDRAILAKAFRGELVPQDPDDEPASVLLERIRAEREAAERERKEKGSGRRGRAA